MHLCKMQPVTQGSIQMTNDLTYADDQQKNKITANY